jgi:dihydrofolate reductase/thymidylate synthase
MGRRTWRSLPSDHQPLPHRVNIVLSSQDLKLDAHVFHNFQNALEFCQTYALVEKIIIIGGASVYRRALQHPGLDHIYQTKINCNFKCDVRFPPFDKTQFTKEILRQTKDKDKITGKICKLTFIKWIRTH